MAAPTIDATVSGESANSYVTEQEVEDYLAIHPSSAGWTEALTTDQRKAVLFAALLIDRETFWGMKKDADQALQFPRDGMTDIPEDVKRAQMEQALDIFKGDYLRRLDMLETQDQGIRQISTSESLQRMVPSHPNAFPMFKLCLTARELIAPYVSSSVRSGRA